MELRRANNDRRRGFSLVEMLATVAALVIVLGLAVSLARYVRRQASDRLTKDLLAQLDVLMRRYQERYHALPAVPAFVAGAEREGEITEQKGRRGDRGTAGERNRRASNRNAASPVRLPTVSPLLPATRPDGALPPESNLQRSATLNNRAVVAALRVEARRHPDEFAGLPLSVEAEGTLHDAWGTPVVFMPAMHPAVGMAMENSPFFLSAGPDRQFRTLEDNLFSYEQVEGESVVNGP